MRTGLVAKKLGMTRVFDESGVNVPVTLLQVDACQVTAVKNKERDGYVAVQLGAFPRKQKNVSKPLRGQFAKAKIEPKATLVEFRVSDDAVLSVGDQLVPSHFVPGQKVDVTATSIGKGYAGGMKRHNFGGLEATHGISVSHRSHGSTGQCQEPGRVFKGKKMAGQLGNVRVTKQNLQVIQADDEAGIIAVKGGVPGAEGGYVLIKDAVKTARPENAPFPAGLANTSSAKPSAEAPESSSNEEASNES